MDIAALNVRITIQRHETLVDQNANHVSIWNDYFSCYATASGSSGGGQNGGQDDEAGMTVDHSDLSFTVRHCSETAAVTITGYRVLFVGEAYDIVSIDHMGFKRKCCKFKCRKVRK